MKLLSFLNFGLIIFGLTWGLTWASDGRCNADPERIVAEFSGAGPVQFSEDLRGFYKCEHHVLHSPENFLSDSSVWIDLKVSSGEKGIALQNLSNEGTPEMFFSQWSLGTFSSLVDHPIIPFQFTIRSIENNHTLLIELISLNPNVSNVILDSEIGRTYYSEVNHSPIIAISKCKKSAFLQVAESEWPTGAVLIRLDALFQNFQSHSRFPEANFLYQSSSRSAKSKLMSFWYKLFEMQQENIIDLFLNKVKEIYVEDRSPSSIKVTPLKLEDAPTKRFKTEDLPVTPLPQPDWNFWEDLVNHSERRPEPAAEVNDRPGNFNHVPTQNNLIGFRLFDSQKVYVLGSQLAKIFKKETQNLYKTIRNKGCSETEISCTKIKERYTEIDCRKGKSPQIFIEWNPERGCPYQRDRVDKFNIHLTVLIPQEDFSAFEKVNNTWPKKRARPQ